MNIKEQIGQRIQQARKAKNLTQAKLAELAGDFSQSRLNNWEKGIRTPGLEEVKGLARALGISSSYIMCLTDQPLPMEFNSYFDTKICKLPILDYQKAIDYKLWTSNLEDESKKFFILNEEQASDLSSNSFAIVINDRSMEPWLHINDFLIIDPEQELIPGAIVAAHLKNQKKIIIRELRELDSSYSTNEFELAVKNPAWANVHINIKGGDRIIGMGMSYFRKIVMV